MPLNITVIQVYAPTSNAEEAEVERFYDDLQDLLELTPKKRCPFHLRGMECKSRKSKEPGVTRNFGLGVWNKAGQRLTEFCQENALVIANTFFQQHKRRLYILISPDGQHQNQTDYILCSQRWRSSIQSAKTRPRANCGSDHELLIAKFRLKLKKVEKATRPFRYDLNQSPYNYTVEVKNRFKVMLIHPRFRGTCLHPSISDRLQLPEQNPCLQANPQGLRQLPGLCPLDKGPLLTGSYPQSIISNPLNLFAISTV